MNCLDHAQIRNVTPEGYAQVKHGGRMVGRHRVVLAEKLGIPERDIIVARHTCDNSRCINPDHLIPGTYKDNVRDMWERGRQVVVAGADHYSTHLTQSDVDAIRTRFVPRCKVNGGTALAAEYRISKQTVCDIVKRRIWK